VKLTVRQDHILLVNLSEIIHPFPIHHQADDRTVISNPNLDQILNVPLVHELPLKDLIHPL